MDKQRQFALLVIEAGMRNHLRASHNRLSGVTEPRAAALMAVEAGAMAKALARALLAQAGGRLHGADITLLRPWLATTTSAALTQAQSALALLALRAAQAQLKDTVQAVTVGGLAGGGQAGQFGLPSPAELMAGAWREMAVPGAVAKAGDRFQQQVLAALDQAVVAGDDRDQALARLRPALAGLAADLAAIARTLMHAVANSARLAAMAAL